MSNLLTPSSQEIGMSGGALVDPGYNLIGGQLVFLHAVERRSIDIRPTDDVDFVVNL